MKEVINNINLLKESIKHLEDKNAERSKTLYWVLGVIVANGNIKIVWIIY